MATFNFGQPVGTNPLASPPNTRTTSIGSINKDPGLGRTAFGETVTVNGKWCLHTMQSMLPT